MSKHFFASQFLVGERGGNLLIKNKIGTSIDGVLLDCKICAEKTFHSYEGFKDICREISEFYYKCEICGNIYISHRKL